MNARISVLATAVVAIVLFAGAPSSQAAVYDLADDWSDASNPNGVWSLKKNHVDLFTINQPDYYQNGTNQKAWADQPSALNAHVPVWVKRNEDGNINAHSAELDRTGSDYTAAVWTSPLAGQILMSGKLWTTRPGGRVVRWQLRVDGAVVSQGDLVANGTHDENTPFDLAAGSGGLGALVQTVQIGDEVELGLVSVSQSGDLGDVIGMDLTIVPEPTTLAMMVLGTLKLLTRRRKREGNS